jgi:PAS domain-containing protein
MEGIDCIICDSRSDLDRRPVFENRVLRRIFGPKREEVTGEWRKLHSEELNGLYSLPNIVRVIKSRRMRWAGHVACMGEGRVVYRVLVGKPEGKRPLGRPRRNGRIVLGWIFKKWDVGVRTGLGWLRIGIRGGRL